MEVQMCGMGRFVQALALSAFWRSTISCTLAQQFLYVSS